jgi:WhiB family redox-sensing transcriptional regulator
MRDALCVEYPEIDFFPGRGGAHTVNTAKQVCACCLVRCECRDYALAHQIEDGIWGGTSSSKRLRMRRDPKPDTSGVVAA